MSAANGTRRVGTVREKARRLTEDEEMWAEWKRLKAEKFPYFTKKVLPILRAADREGKNIYEI